MKLHFASPRLLLAGRGLALLLAALVFWTAAPARAQFIRIKDICAIEGVRENQLIGYGLVTGLNGTGDDSSTGFTFQSLSAFVRRNNINVDPSQIDAKNVAAVMVTATLPAFARQGMQIDVKVSSLGNAKNLQGGMLIATPLRPLTALPGDANSIYAIAQGAISTGGFAAGNNQSSAVKNHPTVALIPDGGIIERAAPNSFDVKPEINFLLRNPDFTTAMRVATAINASLGAEVATARNATVVAVKMPKEGAEDRVRFVAGIENLEVNPDTPARVVYNERTGTIVMGSNVRISTAIITHGNLSFELTKREESDLYVGQNLTGQVAIESTTKETELKVEEQTGEFRVLDQGVTIGEVARGLNALGVSARDIISILQALKECGALQAELVAM